MSAHIEILDTFGPDTIPDLGEAVLGALELFQTMSLPSLALENYRRPLVIGSGNAEATGRILFRDLDAVFASESNFEEKLKKIQSIDSVVVISAYAGKHAPGIVKTVKKYGKKVILITCNPDSLAKKELEKERGDEEYVFPRNREPYTYNTSTYMGMILSTTGEDPKTIQEFLDEKVSRIDFSRLAEYDKFFLIVPNEFSDVKRLLTIKFFELFGRHIGKDIETSEFMGHATTVVPAHELFISFGAENNIWGDPGRRMFVPLPKDAGYGAMMAVGYYIIGQIQKRQKPYFKENIAEYVKHSSEIFGYSINAIVEK